MRFLDSFSIYCGCKYTRTSMINRLWKSPPGIEPATLSFLAGQLDRLAIGTVVYLRLKLFQNLVMNNTWQHIYILLWFCELMQSLHVNCNKYLLHVKEMQILSDSLLQYIYSHHQFDALYCRGLIFPEFPPALHVASPQWEPRGLKCEKVLRLS